MFSTIVRSVDRINQVAKSLWVVALQLRIVRLNITARTFLISLSSISFISEKQILFLHEQELKPFVEKPFVSPGSLQMSMLYFFNQVIEDLQKFSFFCDRVIILFNNPLPKC